MANSMQFYPYDGVQPQTNCYTGECAYTSIKADLYRYVRQIKSIQSIQKTLMAMTDEARPSMIETIKLYLKNEVQNKNNKLDDLLAMASFFDTYGSENFWWTFYASHLNNSMIEKIVQFIG